MAQRLVTTRYTLPGVYIGQLITPRPGNLNADARVCSYIGQGSRLAKIEDSGIRRSFVYDEELTVSSSAPYTATLNWNSNGDNTSPIRLFDSTTGVELRQDQWQFELVGGNYKKIIISPDAYDPNAVYHIDYQSIDRGILDPLPISGLRTIKNLGTSPGRNQYRDFVDYFIPFDYAGPSADSGNAYPSSFLDGIYADGGNLGTGNIVFNTAASYNHNYNRSYVLEVEATGSDAGGDYIEVSWVADRYSGGADSVAPVGSALNSGTFKTRLLKLYDTGAASFSPVDIELGIKVELDALVATYTVGDVFFFNGVGPGLVEFDGRLENTNQYLEFSSSIINSSVAGTVAYGPANTFTGTYNTNVYLEVYDVTGTNVSFYWATYGDVIGKSGSFTVDSTLFPLTYTITDGIEVIFDGTFAGPLADYGQGDVIEFSIRPPRTYYQAKDNRVYDLTISVATNPGADQGYLEGGYSTGTPEGGFGTWVAESNILTGVNAKNGNFSLPDGVVIFARNMMRFNINGTSFAANDRFTGAVTSLDVIDWGLTREVEEIREATGVYVDVTGGVTGNPGFYYVILTNVPSGVPNVVFEDLTQAALPMTMPNSRIVYWMSNPITTGHSAITLSYEFRGDEPNPGQLYFMTANYIRPEALYNNPTLVLTREDGRTFLAPSEIGNHLYIMNEIGFDNNMPGALYIQPKDQDGDGILTDEDFREALFAHEGSSRATDLCVLSHFSSLSDALSVNERANDPFEKREQMLWVGTPIGTPVGDAVTPNTLVYLAKHTLQTTPQSQALGTRVLLSPTTATRSVTLDSGVSAAVTLDGSFVAGAASAMVNSFTDPGLTILRRNMSGFSTIQTYSETDNSILGDASTVILSEQGTGIYRVEEDITVHNIGEDFQLISATTQKQYVTKVVRREMDLNLVGVVVPSPQAAISLIKAQLASILLGLVARGLVGDYQDDDGNVRAFDPDSDIVVVRDPNSLTKYDFWFSYWIRTPIKRLFGLYAVNTNDFGF